ncbi:MAG: hypothetical protein WCF48_05295 [Terriglobales bacterium]
MRDSYRLEENVTQDVRVDAIVSLVQGVHHKTDQLGKIQLQKMIYFLQETGVPLGYKFEIYHYGPYSFELSDQMSSLDSLGVLAIGADPSGYGFNIKVGSHASKYQIDKKYSPKLDYIVNKFGTDSPAQLEVKSTVHFVNKVLKKQMKSLPEKLVVEKVKELKPRFTEKFISDCYGELKAMRLV